MYNIYNELVKRLRRYVEIERSEHHGADLEAEAADAIEELSRQLDTVNDARNEGFDLGYWAARRDFEQCWLPVDHHLRRPSPIRQLLWLWNRRFLFLSLEQLSTAKPAEKAPVFDDAFAVFALQFEPHRLSLRICPV